MAKLELPPAFEEFERIGGALAFDAYQTCLEDEAEALRCIERSFETKVFWPGYIRPKPNIPLLAALGGRPIAQAEFFGEYLNLETGDLRSFGAFHSPSGGPPWIDPPFKLGPLAPAYLKHDPSTRPRLRELGEGGDFARAFLQPFSGLDAKPARIQELFEEIRAFILPEGHAASILDWASPRLPEVHPWFEAGMEWWGVYLFTIGVPSLNRLTVIMASETD